MLAAALLAEEGEEDHLPLGYAPRDCPAYVRELSIAPHVTINMEVDMDQAKAIRQELNADCPPEEKISYNDLIVKAAAQALTEYPALNGSITKDEIIYHNFVHMGVAVALDIPLPVVSS